MSKNITQTITIAKGKVDQTNFTSAQKDRLKQLLVDIEKSMQAINGAVANHLVSAIVGSLDSFFWYTTGYTSTAQYISAIATYFIAQHINLGKGIVSLVATCNFMLNDDLNTILNMNWEQMGYERTGQQLETINNILENDYNYFAGLLANVGGAAGLIFGIWVGNNPDYLKAIARDMQRERLSVVAPVLAPTLSSFCGGMFGTLAHKVAEVVFTAPQTVLDPTR